MGTKGLYTSSALVSVALCLSISGQSLAQDGASATEGDTITVTAQRRESNLQDVPAAVTAISPADIEENQIRDVTDLQYQTPNISIATGTGTANSARIFLRGVGEDESRGAVDPAIAIYVDGVYIGRQVGALFDIVDLERIEVLRGPQGTLYGRNSNGGAIKLISKTPEDAVGGKAGATIGNNGRYDIRGTVNLPLAEGTGLRLTGLYRERDGFHDLIPNGDFEGQNREVGSTDVIAVRGIFSHQLNDNWKITLAADHTQDNSDPVPDSAAPPNDVDNDLFTIEPLDGTTCSELTPYTFQPLGCFLGYDSEIENSGVSFNVDGKLGSFDFSSISAYRQLDDMLASRIGFPYFQETDQEQVSQEFTLTSNHDGPLNYVAGFYYFNEDLILDSTFVLPSTVAVDTDAYALFVHGTAELSPATTLTAGIRYTDETKDLEAQNFGNSLGRAESADFDNWTYNIGVDHRFNDMFMAYTSFSTGTKSGGWSPDCFSAAACYQPVTEEEVESFEVGFRSDLIENRLRLNVTYFFNNYAGLQIGATVPGLGFTRFNVDETEIQGLEIESRFNVTDAFTLYGNLGFLEAEYTSVTESQAGGLTNSGASCEGGIVTVECALGLDLKNAPEYKGLVGAKYEWPLSSGATITVNGDISFEDTSWSLVANDPPHALTDPGELYNARIAYTSADGAYTVSAWGRNLSDEEYWRAASATSFTAYASPPMTYGIDIDVNF